MTCLRCGGLIYDWGDDLGPRCLSCGRGLELRWTIEEMHHKGVPLANLKKEVVGHPGRGREFVPETTGRDIPERRFKGSR